MLEQTFSFFVFVFIHTSSLSPILSNFFSLIFGNYASSLFAPYAVSFVAYVNNSLHLVRKYARIFVRGHYLFREAYSFPRAKLEENCELRRTDNVQGQISEHIFAAKSRPLCLLSSFSWGIFAQVTRLDQSRASENI